LLRNDPEECSYCAWGIQSIENQYMHLEKMLVLYNIVVRNWQEFGHVVITYRVPLFINMEVGGLLFGVEWYPYAG